MMNHNAYARMTKYIEDHVTYANCETIQQPSQSNKTSKLHSGCVSLYPDTVLSDSSRLQFPSPLDKYDEVFSPNISRYNGTYGPFQPTINREKGVFHSILEINL